MDCRQPKKAERRNCNVVKGEDHLSQLPDEIIIDILSRLKIKDSGRTCVLSRRWEKLWLSTSHCSGPKLIFPRCFYSLLSSKTIRTPSFYRKRDLYMGLINKVLKAYPQPLLDELDIDLYMDSTSSSVIDDWIKFACRKGVQRLKLDFSYHLRLDKLYVFPSLRNKHFRGYGNGIYRLRVLCLKNVDVNQEVVDALLSTCPLLETLSLDTPYTFKLTISGETHKLKHLELFAIDRCSYIEISLPYLVSLGYKGEMHFLHVKRVPCLSEFDVFEESECPFFFTLDIHKHLSFLFRLKKFKWYVYEQVRYRFPLVLPQFVNLEALEVLISRWDGLGFLWPTVIIKASPFLRRFTVEWQSCLGGHDPWPWLNPGSDRRRIKEVTQCKHEFLKVVEFIRFKGTSSEIELAQHLFDMGAQSLEKVFIDTRCTFADKNALPEIRKIAQSVGKVLDSSVDFVVL